MSNGQQLDSGQGDYAKNLLIGLRSRKSGTGAATRDLVGSQTALNQGSFGRFLSQAMSGQSFGITAGYLPLSTNDWALRSTASGVVVAYRLDTQAQIDDFILADATADHVSLDTSVKVSDALGSVKFTTLNTDGAASGSISIPFGRTFDEGDVIWFSFRRYAPGANLYQAWPPSETGVKLCILSRDANGVAPIGSNQINEVVVQFNYEGGVYSGYNQDGVNTAVAWDTAIATSCNGSDFKWQSEVDNGANPLTGTNPDTGSAWSSCEQDSRRYGGLYSGKSVDRYRRGLGDPLTGGVRPTPASFDTITVRLEINHMDSATNDNRLMMWIAHDGEAYTLTHDVMITLGAGPLYNGLTLLPYTTNRIAGGRQVSSRTNNITGVTIHAVGNATTVGDGTLEFVSSTGRFRWKGSGETYGTARGYSSANNILILNVCSNSPSESYVVIEVNPALLPIGTQTDTVTVATDRPTSACYYTECIVSDDAPINAPGGYEPTGISPFDDMVVGDWLEVAGSSMSANPPTVNGGGVSGFDYLFTAWGGLCIDTRTSTIWMLAGGGHTDQYSNCVMKIRCDVPNPVWEEVLPSDASGTFTIPNSDAWYSTGKPASSHLYYTQSFIEARNRAMRFGPYGIASSGAWSVEVDGFDSTVALGVNGWDARHTYPSIPDTATPRGGQCNDPDGNVYIHVGNTSVRKWTEATNTWSQLNIGFPSQDGQDTAAAYDTTRNRIGYSGSGATFFTFDPATGVDTARTITGTGATALAATSIYKGMVYVPSLDSYLLRAAASGAQVFKINASTFDCIVMTTSGGGSVPAITGASGENVFTKWLYAPQFGVILYNPTYTSNVWALKVE